MFVDSSWVFEYPHFVSEMPLGEMSGSTLPGSQCIFLDSSETELVRVSQLSTTNRESSDMDTSTPRESGIMFMELLPALKQRTYL